MNFLDKLLSEPVSTSYTRICKYCFEKWSIQHCCENGSGYNVGFADPKDAMVLVPDSTITTKYLLNIIREMKVALNDVGNHWLGYWPEDICKECRFILEQINENRAHLQKALIRCEEIAKKVNNDRRI